MSKFTPITTSAGDSQTNEDTTSNNPYAELFASLLYVRDQAQIFHWQTESYAQHIALDIFYETFNTLADKLAEIAITKNGRFSFQGEALVRLVDLNQENLDQFIQYTENFIKNDINGAVWVDNSIENVLDDILNAIDQLKYLLTLK